MNDPTRPATLDAEAVARAERNVRGIVEYAFQHAEESRALIVADAGCELAVALTEAYRGVLPGAEFLAFDDVAPDVVLEAFARLSAGDLVVLLQSTSFRLDAFRIRLELFARSLKVIEHPHLERMPGAEGLVYIDALEYDRDYYRGVGAALKDRIDRAREAVIDSGGERLVFPAGLEPAKLNVGDYRGMKNVGGQFPIGEVFTESLRLEAVEGRLRIAFFGDKSFSVNRPERPITLVIEGGQVVATEGSTPAFDRVLEDIRGDEGVVWVRELGFGLNRAFSPERTVTDIGSFERMCGVHLSLGAKHASYAKPPISKRRARYHVDVFAATETVLLDGDEVYRDGAWTLEPLPVS